MPFSNDGSWQVSVKDSAGTPSTYSTVRNFDIVGIPNAGTWEISVKDSAGTPSAYSTPRTFTIEGSTTHELEGTLLGDGSMSGSLGVEVPIAASLTGDSSVEADVRKELLLDSSLLSDSDSQNELTASLNMPLQLDSDSVVAADVTGGSALLEALLESESFSGNSLSVEFDVGTESVSESVTQASLSYITDVAASVDGESSTSADMIIDRGLSADLFTDSFMDAAASILADVSQIIFGESTMPSEVNVTVRLALADTMLGESFLEGDAIIFVPVGLVRLADVHEFKVVIADLLGNELEEVPASELNYAFVLNDIGKCGFELPIDHPKVTPDLLAEGERDVHVYRDSQIVWTGRLWSVEVDTEMDAINCSAGDWLSVLAKRHIDDAYINNPPGALKFDNQDIFDITWDIINKTQQKAFGDIGITRGSIAASGETATARFNTWERIKVLDALKQFNDKMDFEIDKDKVWRTWLERGSVTSQVFELGKNIGDLKYVKDAFQVVTSLSGLGSGSDKNRCIVVASDVTSRGRYGLLEDSVDFSDIKSHNRLSQKTASELRTIRRPVWQPTMKIVTEDPPFGSYQLGDRPLVVAKHGYVDVNQRFRIIAINVRYEDDGEREEVELYFDESTVGV